MFCKAAHLLPAARFLGSNPLLREEPERSDLGGMEGIAIG